MISTTSRCTRLVGCLSWPSPGGAGWHAHRARLLAAAALACLAGLSPALAGVTVTGDTLDTPRHRITLDGTGLPAQMVIKADPAEVPLHLRGSELADADLQAIGRGPQLRGPMRLQAVSGAETLVATAAKPAQAVAEGDGATCTVELTAGTLRAKLAMRYAEDGSLAGELTYGGQDLAIDKLELILELAGPCDVAVAGAPVAEPAQAYAPKLTDLGTAEGVAWSNLADPAEGRGVNQPGVLTHFFLGSGDRGFTWLTPDDQGFVIDAKAPGMVVERDKAGQLNWRIALVNTLTNLKTARSMSFAILVHPARPPAPGRRAACWKPWTGDPVRPPLTAAARKAGAGFVRADAATVHEAGAARALLVGPAGGDARTAVDTLADTYPMGLFRYLAAPHTALAVQLRSNAAALASPGASPANDRMALGRALLHDVGIDLAGLGQRVAAANLARALEAFGYFTDDGKTEFIPYWRSGRVVRYGEAFAREEGFEVTAENPMARAYVSLYLRPGDRDASKRKALFVIVNERDTPMREQFYLLQPERLFGGPNKVTAQTAINRLDFSRIPADSDWRKSAMLGSATAFMGGRPEHLLDLEDNGFVRARSIAGGMEIYGLLYVPARGVRILFGTGE